MFAKVIWDALNLIKYMILNDKNYIKSLESGFPVECFASCTTPTLS